MKVTKKTDEILEITTTIYQARNGAIMLNWGKSHFALDQKFAENIATEFKDFDCNAYNKFYNNK